MIRLYDGVFDSLVRWCTWAARDDRYAPESAAMLVAALQFLNIVTVLLLFTGNGWLSNNFTTVAGTCFAFLIALNLWCFMGGKRWRSVIAEFDKQDSRRAPTIIASMYSVLSIALFLAVAW